MDAFWTESKSASPPRRNIPASTGYCLSINSLPQETQPVSNLMASQSFPARRRENKIKIFKIPGHVPGILNYNQASVRRRRARRPMQIPLRAKPALRDSVAKRLFRHAQPLKTSRFQGLVCVSGWLKMPALEFFWCAAVILLEEFIEIRLVFDAHLQCDFGNG